MTLFILDIIVVAIDVCQARQLQTMLGFEFVMLANHDKT